MITSLDGEIAIVLGETTREELENAQKSHWEETPLSPESFLTLREFHQVLRETRIPFLMIVDGCMANETFMQQLRGLGYDYDPQIGGMADYVGPSRLVFDEPSQMSRYHAAFGAKQTYIEDNPIIFAAKPGTYAFAQENPRHVGAPLVGPRAAAISFWAGRISATKADPSLSDVVDRITGWRGVGEINVEGAISWGNYDRIDRILERIRPGGLKGHPDSREAVRKTLRPEVGTIQDFALVDQSQSFLLLTKVWDDTVPKFRWDAWKYQEGQAPASLAQDIPFPKLESAKDGFLLYVEPNKPKLRWHSHDGNSSSRILRNESVSKIFPSYDRNSIYYTIEDATWGTETDELFETSGEKPVRRDQFDLTAYESIAPWTDGSWILVSGERDGRVFRRQGESIDFLRKLPFPPREVISSKDAAYFFSWDNKHAVRWNGNDEWSQVDLLTGKDELLAPFEFWHGGCAISNGLLYLASGNEIFALEEQQLSWRPLAP